MENPHRGVEYVWKKICFLFKEALSTRLLRK
jgi:hypothetical protein